MCLNLVMKEGCEWLGNKLVTLSHALDSDRRLIENTCMNTTMHGV